jgi:mRNA-degrading endonuclease RelE of RelBE toxin-antitoxin system
MPPTFYEARRQWPDVRPPWFDESKRNVDNTVAIGRRKRFSLAYDPEVRAHLRAIQTKHHSSIRAGIEEQLQFEPDIETRNRKPLQPPGAFGATWELRLGANNRFRVLYAVDYESHEVEILAIGVKHRNRLTVGGEEVEL